MHAHVALNYILGELERRSIQTFIVHPAYAESKDSECGKPGYSGHLLLTRLSLWKETSPPTVNGGSEECFNTGHDNIDVRFFNISMKSEKGGAHTHRHCSNSDEHLSHGHSIIFPPACNNWFATVR